jgi:phytoene/squalene synthetase
MRLQFWRDTTETIFRGDTPPDHPVARALAKLVDECHPPMAEFDAVLTARAQDLGQAPFEQWSDLDAYIDSVTGAVTRLAVYICAPDMEMTKQKQTAIGIVSRAWGYVGLLRALPDWMANGRTFYPATLRENLGISGRVSSGQQDEAFFAFAAHAVLDRALGAQRAIARYEKVFPKVVFPAVGHASLAPLYLRREAERSLGRAPKTPSLLRRQWKLVLASASGTL